MQRVRSIEAIFFDGDQTLWDFETMMRRALAATLAELHRLRPEVGREHPDLDVDSLIADREEVAAELRGRESNLERIRLVAFRRTLSRCGLEDNGLADHLNTYYLDHRFSNVLLYPDTISALTSLRADYRLGFLSNGNSYPDRCGLDGMFTTVVFAQDHGISKPDRRIFDIAAGQIGLPPERLVMVGDSLVKDVTAAQDAGWRAIWLNRSAAPCPDGHRPDAEIATLEELPAVVESLASRPV